MIYIIKGTVRDSTFNDVGRDHIMSRSRPSHDLQGLGVNTSQHH